MEIWEAAVTLLLFPVLVYCAYIADKGLPWTRNSRIAVTTENGKQIELGSIQPGECKCNRVDSMVFGCHNSAKALYRNGVKVFSACCM